MEPQRGGTLGKMKNISEPRSVAEWVAACHGVGCQPGDGKLRLSVLAALPCHPASWRGSGLITTPYPGLTPWAMILLPLRAQVSARRWLAKVSIYRAPYSNFGTHVPLFFIYLIWILTDEESVL